MNSRATGRIALQRQNDIDSACVVIPDKLYFMTAQVQPKPDQERHFFCIDTVLRYEPFFMDFGPLNLACLYHFCEMLKGKLNEKRLENHKIYFYTACDAQRIANAAYLIGCYQIIQMNRKPDQAYQCIQPIARHGAVFRDASMGLCTYRHTVLTTLVAVAKAVEWKFLDFSTFDVAQYEYYERVEYGDFNILIPGKFIAFAGPSATNIDAEGYPALTPEYYIKIWRKLGVTDIIRLNKKCYDKSRFTRHGFQHFDIYYTDGTVPSKAQLKKFLTICENAKGVVSVHCKAGLGRTGTCIGCYMMKHYRWSAADVIAWLRVCRPGSVLGPQAQFLEMQQPVMWKEGQLFRKNFMNQQATAAQPPPPASTQAPMRKSSTGGLRGNRVMSLESAQDSMASMLSPPSALIGSTPQGAVAGATRSASGFPRYSSSPLRSRNSNTREQEESAAKPLPRYSPRSPLTPPTTSTPARSASTGRASSPRVSNTRAYSRYTRASAARASAAAAVTRENLTRATPTSSQLNHFQPAPTRSRTQPPSQITSLARRSWVKSAISDLGDPSEDSKGVGKVRSNNAGDSDNEMPDTKVQAGLKASNYARAGLGAPTSSNAPLPTDPGQNQARALLNAKKVSQAATRQREHSELSDMPLQSAISPHPSMLPTPSNKFHLQRTPPRPSTSQSPSRLRARSNKLKSDSAMRVGGSRWSSPSSKLKRVTTPPSRGLSTSTSARRRTTGTGLRSSSGLGRRTTGSPASRLRSAGRLSGYTKSKRPGNALGRTGNALGRPGNALGLNTSKLSKTHSRSRSSPAVRSASANRRVGSLGTGYRNPRLTSSRLGGARSTRSTLSSLRSRLGRRSGYSAGDGLS